MVRIEFLFLILFLNSNENNINNETNKVKNFFEKTFLKSDKKKTSKKNLLIGSVVNYNWAKIAPFFKSLKQANFKNCDFVIPIFGKN